MNLKENTDNWDTVKDSWRRKKGDITLNLNTNTEIGIPI